MHGVCSGSSTVARSSACSITSSIQRLVHSRLSILNYSLTAPTWYLQCNMTRSSGYITAKHHANHSSTGFASTMSKTRSEPFESRYPLTKQCKLPQLRYKYTSDIPCYLNCTTGEWRHATGEAQVPLAGNDIFGLSTSATAPHEEYAAVDSPRDPNAVPKRHPHARSELRRCYRWIAPHKSHWPPTPSP